MTTYETDAGRIRVDARNPDHHLFRNNGGNWWIHYMGYPTPQTAERVRRSLGTKCIHTARRRRDAILAQRFPCYGQSLRGQKDPHS